MNKSISVQQTSDDDLVYSIQEFTFTLKKYLSENTFRDTIRNCAIIEKNGNKCDVILHLIKVV